MDTLAERWTRLEPFATFHGPEDARPRPTVLLFHGCGGLRPHLPIYAEQAKAAGWRAVIVDSFAPRGWSREFAMTMVCSGVLLRGWERAGDILAALEGVARRPDVDGSRLAVAGWSHGGWGIMEAMSCARDRPGRLGVADPWAADLERVKAAFLAYPYVGVAALNRMRPWRQRPKTLVITASRDHLTTLRNADRVSAAMIGCGVPMESWTAPGTHAFDEPMNAPPMRYDPDLAVQAHARFRRLLESTAEAPEGEDRVEAA